MESLKDSTSHLKSPISYRPELFRSLEDMACSSSVINYNNDKNKIEKSKKIAPQNNDDNMSFLSEFIGSRVVRGPDWKWGKQDGGEGYVGTVRNFESPEEVLIVWDHGTAANYRCSMFYDLRILDSASAGIKHDKVTCNYCQISPVHGIRWKCGECSNVDLCSLCYHGDKHNTRHRFFRINRPRSEKVLLESRRKCKKKINPRGLFPGARVARGVDWKWGEQDGCDQTSNVNENYLHNNPLSVAKTNSPSSNFQNVHATLFKNNIVGNSLISSNGGFKRTGKIVDLQEWTRTCPRSAVYVIWDSNNSGTTASSATEISSDSHSNGIKNLYRVGYQGMVDLKVVNAGKGIPYYKEHLPLLGEQITSSSNVGTFNIDDKVNIDLDLEVVQSLQHTHGGWTDEMFECLGSTGTVIGIDEDQDIIVMYPSGNRWTLNPATLNKASNTNTANTNKSLPMPPDLEGPASCCSTAQVGHGEWSDSMKSTLGNFGKVQLVYGDGDLKIEINGVCWTFNPKLVSKVVSESEINGETNGVRLSAILKRLFENHVCGDFNEELVKAAANGDHVKCREILSINERSENSQEKFVDVDSIFSGYAAIHVSCQNGHIEVIKILLKHRANIQLEDKNGDLPIHHAAIGDEPHIIELLANFREGSKIIAEQHNNVENDRINDLGHHQDLKIDNQLSMAANFCSYNIDLNARNRKRQTALHIAVNRGFSDVVEMLLKLGAHPNLQDLEGDTPVHDAVSKKKDEILSFLLNFEEICRKDTTDSRLSRKVSNVSNNVSSNINHKISHKNASTFEMSGQQNFGKNKFIVKDTDLITTTNNNGFNALHLASLRGNPNAVKIILNKLVDKTWVIDEKKDDGYTALHLAALNNHVEVLDLLLDQGKADPNARNANLQTALHLAVERQHFGAVKRLLTPRVKAHVDLTSSHSSNAYYNREDHTNIGKNLEVNGKYDDVSSNADTSKICCAVEAQDKDGDTALHEAVRHHTLAQLKHLRELQDIGKLLIGVGLNINQNSISNIPLNRANLANPSSPANGSDTVPINPNPSISNENSRNTLNIPGSAPQYSSCNGNGSNLLNIKKSSAAIACYLVSKGGLAGALCLDIKNKKGQTPLDLCPDPNLTKALKNFYRMYVKERNDKDPSITSSDNDLNNPGNSLAYECDSNTSDDHIDNEINFEQPSFGSTPATHKLEATKLLNLRPQIANNNNVMAAKQESPYKPSSSSSVLLLDKYPSNRFSRPKINNNEHNKNMVNAVNNFVMATSDENNGKEAIECLVCSEKKASVLFKDCGHVCVCQSCSVLVKKCVKCRATIRQAVPIVETIEKDVKSNNLKSSLLYQDNDCRKNSNLDLDNLLPSTSSNNRDDDDDLKNESGNREQGSKKNLKGNCLNENISNYKDVQKLQQQLRDIKEQTMCPVCLDRFKNMIFLCGHGTCQMCGDRMNECPICRKCVDKKILLY
ncbi:unnamed protein product [Gordionus sp. m RMFG-2023]